MDGLGKDYSLAPVNNYFYKNRTLQRFTDSHMNVLGAKWKSRRKLITPSFHFSILQDFISVFDSVGENLLRKLRSEVGKDSVEISKIISLYTLDVICGKLNENLFSIFYFYTVF